MCCPRRGVAQQAAGRAPVSVAVVVGNPKAGSRTLRVAMAAAGTLADLPGAGPDRLVLDLAEVAASSSTQDRRGWALYSPPCRPVTF